MVRKVNDKTKLTMLFAAMQDEMLSRVKFSNILDHPTDQGDNAEVSWIEWFNNYLPKRYKANKATVIDSNGNVSNQIDIVLYDAQYSYLAFNQNDILYVPAESVYAVFEVKQTLKKEYMEYAGKKAASVRQLYRTSAPIPYAAGVYPPKRLHSILAGILTTQSEWSPAYGAPFMNCIQSYSDEQRVDCGCVLSCGAFFYNYNNKELKQSCNNEALVHFFLQLLILLQEIGTVPAIDLSKYMSALAIQNQITSSLS